MNQNSFAKIKEMNIKSNVVFANQSNETSFKIMKFGDDKTAKMITTDTKGVGINRNLALLYATRDICLFSDDDVCYFDNAEEIVLSEFKNHPNADAFLFHFLSDSDDRLIKSYKKTRRVHRFEKKPWATFQIAFRLSSIKKQKIFFSTLFGGGCIYPCGEDSLIIREMFKKKLKIFVSKYSIGRVSFKESSWFSGYNQSYFYGQGAFYQLASPFFKWIWFLYVVFRTRKDKELSNSEKMSWMKKGACGFKKMLSYSDYLTLDSIGKNV